MNFLIETIFVTGMFPLLLMKKESKTEKTDVD